MKANRAAFPLAAMCRVLGLSTSGYYGWLRRRPSARSRRDEEVKFRIMEIWTESRETYGRPRIHAALAAEGVRVSRKRVARTDVQVSIPLIEHEKRVDCPAVTVLHQAQQR